MKKLKGTVLFLGGVLIGSILAGSAFGIDIGGVMAQRSTQTVFVDGSRVELETYLINDSNYVKLRDVGQVINFNVYWDGSAVQMQSRSPYTGMPPAASQGGQTTGTVGQDAAINKALANAGFSRGEVTALTAKQDYDDGRLVYEVEFYAGGVEYDYEIDAATGNITDIDIDHSAANYQSGDIGREAAINKALTQAGLKRSDVTRLTAKQDYDDGRLVYEVEFYVGYTEYSYDIDAATGDILDADIDYERD
ncbi:MAG: PepSY domain-containing protein [Clostridia bacterium]|nr:PepSY domain-containing protein [Clostridia bacterium]